MTGILRTHELEITGGLKTFTTTLTGCVNAQVITVEYSEFNGVITMSFPELLVTFNNTSAPINFDIPAHLIPPTFDRLCLFTHKKNTTSPSTITMSIDGHCYISQSFTAINFTAATDINFILAKRQSVVYTV